MALSPFEQKVQEYKRQLVREALADANWSIRGAARALGISAKAVSHRMRRAGITLPQGHPMAKQHLNFKGVQPALPKRDARQMEMF